MSNWSLIKRIWEFAKPFRKTIGIIFICILLTSVIEAVNTYFLSIIFDVVQKHSNDIQYMNTALMFAGFAAIGVFVRILVQRFQGNLEIRKLDITASNHLNHYSISKYFNFSNGQHINEHSGVKQNIITSGFQSVQGQISMFVYHLFPAIANFIVSIVMLFTISYFIGFSYLIISIVFFLSVYKFNIYLQPKLRKVRDARNQTARTISELYRFVFLIKNEVAEKKSLEDLDNVQDGHQIAYERAWIPGNNWLTLIRIGTAGFRYITILFAVWLLFNGQITAGAIFLIFTWSQNFIMSLWMITDMQKQFITDKMNIEKYFELLEIKPDIEDIKNPISENINGDIEFTNVEFSYPVRTKSHNDKDEKLQPEMVLKGISFKIKQGEKVAFVGESGSGKSTIANLIRRAFDPQSGQITINNNNLKDLELKLLLKKIGSVDQEVNLFDKSIRENISYGSDKLLTDDQLNKISKMSRIDTFYKKLEHGWDTILGERGAKVSGGEKQRIGIARALAKNPQILIFDEATSALDTVSERVVQKSIDAVSKEKTSIIIAHRLSTVKNCDRIFVLKNGQLVSEGTHEDLLKKCEYYKELVKHQLTNKDE
jgi:ABC-type multidrug transport system fused ATPase/permease subunit